MRRVGLLRVGVGLLLSAVLALAACGGGGGGDDGNGGGALSGWWLVESRETGTAEPFGPLSIVRTADEGPVLWANGLRFTRTGDELFTADPSPTAADREEISLVVVGDDRMEGLIQVFSSGALSESSDLQLTRRAAPTGSFTLSGTVAGGTAALASSTAYGVVDDGPGGIEAIAIVHSDPYAPETTFEVYGNGFTLAAGGYGVGAGPTEVSVSVSYDDRDDNGTGGNVTFTTLTPTRIAGTYAIDMGTDAITGSFDVEVAFER